MVEVSFYHLQMQPLEQALPKLLEKVFERGLPTLVRVREPQMTDYLNNLLWTYRPDSFLPHDTDTSKTPDQQPLLISAAPDQNMNGASVLVLLQDADAADLESYDRCLYMFDGNDPASLNLARARWKLFKEDGCTVTYWQQSETGWQKKA